ncbi:MAG: hypothetical protein WBB01_11040 [Phormidesmis sp.]
MSTYRRAYTAGSTVFLTWVTYRPAPLFSHPDTVALLRQAIRKAKREAVFQIVAAVILPDHLHFIWMLPPDDHNSSKREGVYQRDWACQCSGAIADSMGLLEVDLLSRE